MTDDRASLNHRRGYWIYRCRAGVLMIIASELAEEELSGEDGGRVVQVHIRQALAGCHDRRRPKSLGAQTLLLRRREERNIGDDGVNYMARKRGPFRGMETV